MHVVLTDGCNADQRRPPVRQADPGRPPARGVGRAAAGGGPAAAAGPGANGRALALAGKNPRGATFKIASSLALVRKGATANTKLPCTNTLTVNGRQFANYTDFPSNKLGNIPLTAALAFSCNTAFISQYQKVSQAELTSAAQSLGMGESLDLPFTGFLGSVPPTTDVVEPAASFIGPGRMAASPLTMELAVASVMGDQTARPKLASLCQTATVRTAVSCRSTASTSPNSNR